MHILDHPYPYRLVARPTAARSQWLSTQSLTLRRAAQRAHVRRVCALGSLPCRHALSGQPCQPPRTYRLMPQRDNS